MKKFSFLLLYVLSIVAGYGQHVGAVSSSKIITPSSLELTTFTSNFVPKDVLVYKPRNFNSLAPYAIGFFFHGDGAKGTVTIVTNQAVATGDGSTTVFNSNFTNVASSSVLYSSVIVKVAGSTVATGKANGTITGTGVTGTMSHESQSANAAFSLTFTTAPANGQAITIDYKYTKLFEAGFPMYLNSGDEPMNILWFCPQINTGQTDFNLTWDFDNLKTYVTTNYPNADIDRIYCVGLSRGAFFCRQLLINRTSQVASVVIMASNYGAGYTWDNYTDCGQYWIHGTADGTVFSPLETILNESNAADKNIALETTYLWNIGHTGVVWNDNVSNRKERTDAAGTAPFDFIRWESKFSKDQTERANLHVDAAEYTYDLSDYRLAKYQVDALSSGAEKDELNTRLTQIKSRIGTVYSLDLGDPATTSTGNINNLTTLSSGTSLSNIIDDTGGASSKGFTITTQFTGVATKYGTSQRSAGRYHGLPRDFNRDWAIVATGATGTAKFTGLNPSKKYTLIFYCFSYQSGVGTKAETTITLGSAKAKYTELSSFYKIEFKDVTPDGSNEIVFTGNGSGGRDSGICGIDLIEQP